MTTATTEETASMDVADYIRFVTTEGDGFAAAAQQGALDVEIEPCPDWTMRDLVRHLGMIHLWAAANVAFPTDDWPDVDDLPDLVGYWPELARDGTYPDDDELVDWYRATLANLVRVLSEAPADHQCFSFLPAPTPLTMWSRRQASEIAIHRYDAELPRGIVTEYEPAFATDMLDELLMGFTPRPRELDVDGQRVVHVHTADTDEHWWVTLGSDDVTTAKEGGEADLVLTGRATDLYLLLWNRTPHGDVTMEGDASLVDLWRGNFRVRWH